MKQVKWAVLGTGYIANRFANDILCVGSASRTAVVSRTRNKAESFAQKYGFDSAYTDFSKMLLTEKPDAVYIATPNDCHFEQVMQALDSGVNVLCEKPMADNLAQLECMLNKAKNV